MDEITSGQDSGGSFQIAALQHSSGATIDGALLEITGRLKEQGYRLAGAVRASTVPQDEERCDLILEDLSTSTVHSLSQNLGSGSHACRLDDGALGVMAERIEASLQAGPDILIVNKFGKEESEGRGMRAPIVKAVEQGIPVLVGLNSGRVQAWNEFCGAASELFGPGDPALDRWLDATLGD